ncbi:amidohydrolase, partial [Desertihabitans aurantiacus]|uniref:amidohydrolase n=1 Tax=Desertihabitans aurantiacus TaxID=2282477 RepID=UPI000DF7D69E
MSAAPGPSETAPLLVRGVRRVGLLDRPDDAAPLDLRLAGGRVVEVGPRLPARGDAVLDAGGAWTVPGLWDQHVHLGQWGSTFRRLDTASSEQPADVLALVAERVARLAAEGASPTEVVTGYGHRTGSWWQPPLVADLDAVSGDHPVVLVSGDVHSGWLNTAALRMLGMAPREHPVEEREWFELQPRLLELPGAAGEWERGIVQAAAAAAGRGVVGVTDLEFAPNHRVWPARLAEGLRLRVRAGVYPGSLGEVVEAGLRTGQVLDPARDPDGLLTMGPLKIISDGSLNTRTAWCCQPYAVTSAELVEQVGPTGSEHHGGPNYSADELERLLTTARRSGLEVAVHAIGDAAVRAAVACFERTGASGSIEHAQLVRVEDVAAMARLGLAASVQPAHLWDDRDVTELNWPGRSDRCFMFRAMLDAGVELRLGSDAPVSPLDPWRSMAAAVHRSGDDRAPWHREQALTAAEALAASTDGVHALTVGAPADLVLLDR